MRWRSKPKNTITNATPISNPPLNIINAATVYGWIAECKATSNRVDVSFFNPPTVQDTRRCPRRTPTRSITLHVRCAWRLDNNGARPAQASYCRSTFNLTRSSQDRSVVRARLCARFNSDNNYEIKLSSIVPFFWTIHTTKSHFWFLFDYSRLF